MGAKQPQREQDPKCQVTRRALLKGFGFGLSALALARPSSLFACDISQCKADLCAWKRAVSPIDRTLPNEAVTRTFFGDQPSGAHKILWNQAAYSAGVVRRGQQTTEQSAVVIIGGGISGLTTAYKLRHLNPIILEQAPRLGGNSKGHAWCGLDYAIGAAYLIVPEADSAVGSLLRELGLDQELRMAEAEKAFEYQGAIHADLWRGPLGMDPKSKAQFASMRRYLRQVADGEVVRYPDIPITDHNLRGYIDELDSVSLIDHLRDKLKGELNPVLESAVERYCWSSFGGSAAEIGAASGLNFLAAEQLGVAVLPGGNAAVAERLMERLADSVPHSNIRTGCLVYRMTVQDQRVMISYFDHEGKDRQISAKAVVAACPKFVLPRIIDDLEPERIEAIRRLRYRSYIVANLLLTGAPPRSFYDLYLLGDGSVNFKDVRSSADRQQVTDVVLANFARPNPDRTVLTFYRAYPYDGARASLLSDSAYNDLRSALEKQIFSSILPLLGISQDRVLDLRIARWGHPLPLAERGLIASGIPEKICKPFRNKIFFAHQDNWALPAFETSVVEALRCADAVGLLFSEKARKKEQKMEQPMEQPMAAGPHDS